MNLAGKVAIVTGAGRGIGRAVALELAREGAAVALAAKTGAEIEGVAAEIAGSGGQALAVPTDVGDPASVQRLVEAVESWRGPADILVNNAGVRGPMAFVQNVAPEEFQEVLRVNLLGVFYGARAVLPKMVQRRWGRIVNLSGGGAWTGIRGGAPYGASKSAVEGLTRTIAQEVARFNVTCNAMQPGLVDTRTFPIAEYPPSQRGGGVGPEHAGRLVAWLCTDEAAGITGWTINAPEWDRRRAAGATGRAAAEAAGGPSAAASA